jgi:hypothetical protein
MSRYARKYKPMTKEFANESSGYDKGFAETLLPVI